ncbi:hypothetical protein D9Q98_004768 [Chlorella vulgaris]|uniref:Programmed cell death protein 2 C-terminal domain-containing protein n=1 Tax=Chlorella vulgaris TaxID=3077 RepID=A0A9D4TQI8_CHLVU|nr:hypothetical protein D9Q98_004768 [Chlorella vulgaris]
MAAEHDGGSDAESEEERCEWLLGFVQPPRKRTDLLRHRFPSKVGGRPAWLDPLHLPTEEQLTCRVTGKPLNYLLQVYAPLDGNPSAFHRALFLFVSPDGDKLVQAGSVRALRCQLSRANRFYPPDPPKKTDVRPPQLPEDDRRSSLARDRWRVLEHEQQQQQQQQQAANGAASSRLSQGAAAAVGGVQGAAAGGELAAATGDRAEGGEEEGSPLCVPQGALFPEAEVVVEPEDDGSDDDGAGQDQYVRQLVQQYKQQTAQGAYSEEELPGSLVDELEGRISPEQRHFATFQARVGKEPAQCLRYCFDAGATPLWPSSKNIPGRADVPACERCGAPRQFEFQVMPQMLVHLGVEADDPLAPDWGAIAVYSCSASCDSGVTAGASSPDESAYLEEFVWVQESA